MPYATNEDLPPAIRRVLPRHAQDIFREAFNASWVTYRAQGQAQREMVSRRVAWAAVKRKYAKIDGQWVAVAA